MSTVFGEIRRPDLRSVWPDEARNFTPWLAENLKELGAVLGMELELVDVEASVGDFSADILARDLGTGSETVIENQFGATDHDHLGKLITYGAGSDAGTVVWIAESVREEHRQALDWLNQRTDSDTQFFAIVIEIIQIDDSNPAFNFRPVVFPNEWTKSRRGRKKRSVSPKGESYRLFFQRLIDTLREKHRFTNAKVGQPQSWYSFSSGISGISYGASFALGDRLRSEVYLDLGEQESNKALFDQLYEQKLVIEEEFGQDLEWERLDDRRASRIAVYRPGRIEDDETALQEYESWVVEKILKFKAVFQPRLTSAKVDS